MSKPKRHRNLRQGCDCVDCAKKLAALDEVRQKLGSRGRQRRTTQGGSAPRGGGPLACPSCGGPKSQSARRCRRCVDEENLDRLLARQGQPPPVELHVLYRFFDSTGALLYVGITKSIWGRVKGHEKSQHWWSEVSYAEMKHYKSRNALVRAESLAIKAESPRYNVVHNVCA